MRRLLLFVIIVGSLCAQIPIPGGGGGAGGGLITDPTKSGTLLLSGLTSGGSGFAAADVAGSLIFYQLPIWNGSTSLVGKILTDSGAVTCGTLDSSVAGIPCHQLIWDTAGLPLASQIRTCEIQIGGVGSGSPVLADDDDPLPACSNQTGLSMTILQVDCWANSGTASTVLPIITGGASTSIIASGTPLTCGNGAFGTASTMSIAFADGATVTGNIAVAGGTAKALVIRIKMTL